MFREQLASNLHEMMIAGPGDASDDSLNSRPSTLIPGVIRRVVETGSGRWWRRPWNKLVRSWLCSSWSRHEVSANWIARVTNQNQHHHRGRKSPFHSQFQISLELDGKEHRVIILSTTFRDISRHMCPVCVETAHINQRHHKHKEIGILIARSAVLTTACSVVDS